MKNIFIIGSRGYTRNYGGWETFVHGLIDNWDDDSINYYVFELANDEKDDHKIEVHGKVTCISVFVKQTGSIAMILCDYYATKYAYHYVRDNNIENPVFYYLGLRIGPYIKLIKNKLHKAGIILLENPAGLEWKRTKWNRLVQIYTIIAAKSMASSVDYLICDNGGILEAYNAFRCCQNTKKIVIPYGAYPKEKLLYPAPKRVIDFFEKCGVNFNNYYLVLGRLVPENNYDLMLSELIKYNGNKKILIICNIEKENKYFKKLMKKYHIDKTKIVFAGELYDKEILSYVRQNAYGYIHGHSVGGTNPGLLEAMSNTKINILYDCVFNREVGKDCAFYFDKANARLSDVLKMVDALEDDKIIQIGQASFENMAVNYSWELICKKYQTFFEELSKK